MLRTCAFCSGEVLKRPSGPPAVYCSQLCRSRASSARRDRVAENAREREANAARRRARACAGCGSEFTPERTNKQRFCSERCGRRADNAKRRARLKGAAEAVRIERFEVGDRDGWICGLCDHPIDPMVPYPNRESASLDHIVPLAKGGQHVEANVQIAHLRCNVAKSDRLAA